MTEEIIKNTVIVEDEALKHGFTQLPNYVLKNPKLSFGARLTYAVLLSYAWQEEFCFPAQEKLAEDLGVSRQSINKFLNELKAAKLVDWKRQGLNRPNIYRILDVNQSLHPDVKQRLPQDVKQGLHEEDSSKYIQNNVNVSKKDVDKSYKADDPAGADGNEAMAQYILEQLGDRKSLGFYRKVARLMPEGVIYRALSETKDADLTGRIRRSRGACFTDLVKRYAKELQVSL
jgi:DNA-binding MarR family transcriptional regulator